MFTQEYSQGNPTTLGDKSKTYFEFEVETIIDHRVKPDGGIEYLLKWKDYGDEENSWINEEDTNAPSLIRHYWTNKDKHIVKRKRGRPPKRGADRGRGSSRNVNIIADFDGVQMNGLNDEKEIVFNEEVYMIDTNNYDDSDITTNDLNDLNDLNNLNNLNDLNDLNDLDEVNDENTIDSNESDENHIEIPQWLQANDEENEKPKCYFTPYNYNTWENCATILNVVREINNNDEGDIFIHIKWPDGTDSFHHSKEVYQKCPLKMIQFYEKHLIITNE